MSFFLGGDPVGTNATGANAMGPTGDMATGGGNLKRVDDESELVAPSSITAGGGGAGGAAYYCTDCGCYFTDEDGTVAEDYMIGCDCLNNYAHSPRMAAMGDAAASNTAAGEHHRRRQQQHRDTVMSERSKFKQMQHKMMTCTTFDAQDWLEKNKRLNRSGTYKFYNKSEEKYRKLASEHFKTTYQSEFKDYGDMVRRAQKSNSQRSHRSGSNGASSSRKGGETEESRSKQSKSRGVTSSGKHRHQDSTKNSNSKTKPAGKPSTHSSLAPRREVDSLCCCEAEQLPHPNHDLASVPPLSPSGGGTGNNVLPLGIPPQTKRQHPANPGKLPITGCYPGGVPGDVDELDRQEHAAEMLMAAGSNANMQFQGQYPAPPPAPNGVVQPPPPNMYNSTLGVPMSEMTPINMDNTLNTSRNRNAPMNDWRQSSNYLQQPIPSAPAFVLRRDPQFGEDRNGWPPQQVPPPPPIGAQQVYYVQQPMASDVEMMGGNMGGGIPGMAPTAANIQGSSNSWMGQPQFRNDNRPLVGTAHDRVVKWRQPVDAGPTSTRFNEVAQQPPNSIYHSTQHQGNATSSNPVQVKYIYPSVCVESHLQDERGPTMIVSRGENNASGDMNDVTARGNQSAVDVITGGKSKGLVTSHRDRSHRNHDRMRYRSHSNIPITGEEITKSQRISQFLEDVSRQLQPTNNYQSQPAVNTATGGLSSSKNNNNSNSSSSYSKLHSTSSRVGPSQRPLKYPTYERDTKVHSEQKPFITASTSVPPPEKRTMNSRTTISPKSSSANLLVSRAGGGETPRLSEKTKNIMAKYGAGDKTSGVSGFTSGYMKKGPNLGMVSGTTQIVSFEEFSQRRNSLTEATQAMIKEVKSKSERLASQVDKASTKDSSFTSSSPNSTATGAGHTVGTEDMSGDSAKDLATNGIETSHADNTSGMSNQSKEGGKSSHGNGAANQSGAGEELVDGEGDRPRRPPQAIGSSRKDKKGEADSKPRQIQTERTSMTRDPSLNANSGNTAKGESWTKLLTETLSRIPQTKRGEAKDKVELESLMQRLNSMSTELNSINQQLKKDVLQISSTTAALKAAALY